MPTALVFLLRLRLCGWLRRIGRALGTWKGVTVGIVLGLIFVPAIIGPVLLAIFRERESAATFDGTRQLMPLLLLLATVALSLTTGTKALTFRPPEIDLLFPGPFRRRHLLLYKLVDAGAGTLFMALFIGLANARRFPNILFALAGLWLAVIVIQLLVMTIVLARKAVADPRTPPHARMAVTGAVVLVAAIILFGVIQTLAAVRAGGRWSLDAIHAIARDSPVLGPVLAPFELLTEVVVARSLTDFIVFSAFALVMIGLLLVLIIRLDAYFIDSAIEQSRKISQRLERYRRGGASAVASSSIRVSLYLPWLGGAGPVAWRQLVTAIRNSRVFLLLALVMLACLAPLALMHWEHEIPVIMMSALFVLFVAPSFVQFDFRADGERMDLLKSLPLRPAAIVIGQLLAPTIVLSVLGEAALLTCLPLLDASGFLTATAAVLFVPAAFLLIAIENLIYLLYPTRPPGGNPADITAIARNMVAALFKILLLVLTLGPAVALALLAAYLVSPPLGTATAAVAISGAAAALIVPMSRLYARLDLSREAP